MQTVEYRNKCFNCECFFLSPFLPLSITTLKDVLTSTCEWAPPVCGGSVAVPNRPAYRGEIECLFSMPQQGSNLATSDATETFLYATVALYNLFSPD
ncbi:hypothetical protein DPEC_G00243580 [Dallia pectoralis]|uniref:Uncharacterized protein n=1 Tax=Dallia pectoralis TaxID=75939 RepID=A0ACC2FVK6_DALPE|nr:hypothetical protein DPEC_G00243580 [Dallia pectoralis]